MAVRHLVQVRELIRNQIGVVRQCRANGWDAEAPSALLHELLQAQHNHRTHRDLILVTMADQSLTRWPG
ncbi:hypothetical protein EV147_4890 [Cupriavidus agavae]|uniref:Uncharacterized protein n=2 Tax=Cupriavidus agavae TaxID=1001822 RepID=A0A4Q7RBN6_9BURK|nr:hypothetical protein EV147_4890 [Cupriavidus agavae]